MKRFLIGGTHSGCGKTTITCAVLQALSNRGYRVSAFKCGPDYIDTMFHEKIIGIPSYHLDSFFCDDHTLNYLLSKHTADTDIAVIEGVMGFYDGTSTGSSAHSISRITNTPSVIVIDCKGMSDSIGAVIKGFLSYHKNHIRGFIFNRLPVRLIPFAKKLCAQLHTEYFGCMPKHSISIASRHLGLVTADEIPDWNEKMIALAKLAEEYLLLDKLLQCADAPIPAFQPPVIPEIPAHRPPVIAVAKDRAFCFIYPDNLTLLREMGCEIRFFSPLSDETLPAADGLILSGGYPELYAEQLSGNTPLLTDIRKKITGGLPTIAECGGFLYLHQSLDGIPMANVIPAAAFRTDRLQRFGYITMTAQSDQMLCKKSDTIKAHEFHYYESNACGEGFLAEKTDGRSWYCAQVTENLYAGFPHLYFYSNLNIAQRFVRKCVQYGEQHETNL